MKEAHRLTRRRHPYNKPALLNVGFEYHNERACFIHGYMPFAMVRSKSCMSNDAINHHQVSLSSTRLSIGTEDFIPEEMDHREIAIRVSVMNEVQLLFPSEPFKSLKPRSLYMVFLVEEDVRVERRRTCDCLNHEEFYWQYEVCTCAHQKHRNEEERCIVAFVAEVRP
jgi:hypothetical protein